MISIVTISFNQGQYLPMAVESVLLQEGVDIEYIIVDPGSTDGSRDYLLSLRDPRIRLVLEEDEGPADGLNKGFSLARGEVFGYLNSDDLYMAGALADAHGLLTREPSLDVVYGDGWLIDDRGYVLRRYESTRWNAVRYGLGGVNVLQQATFFKKSTFELTSGFNKRNRTCWDAELLIDMSLTGARIAHRRRDWGMFRLHPGGISGSGRLKLAYLADRERIASKMVRKQKEPYGAALRRYMARGWKLATQPGYTLRRIRGAGTANAQVTRGPGGFVVQVGHAGEGRCGAPGRGSADAEERCGTSAGEPKSHG